MIDLKLTSGHDIDVSGNDLQLVTGTDSRVQNLKQRFSFFKGEWVYDIRKGVPYFQTVFGKISNSNLVLSIFKSVIVNTTGIVRLLKFEDDFNPKTRILDITFSALDEDGELISDTVSVLIER